MYVPVRAFFIFVNKINTHTRARTHRTSVKRATLHCVMFSLFFSPFFPCLSMTLNVTLSKSAATVEQILCPQENKNLCQEYNWTELTHFLGLHGHRKGLMDWAETELTKGSGIGSFLLWYETNIEFELLQMMYVDYCDVIVEVRS